MSNALGIGPSRQEGGIITEGLDELLLSDKILILLEK